MNWTNWPEWADWALLVIWAFCAAGACAVIYAARVGPRLDGELSDGWQPQPPTHGPGNDEVTG